MVAVLAVVLAACSSPDEGPEPTATTSATPVVADEGLRPVRMTSGRALTYVHPDTASQILCQVLDKGEWERLLDGAVGRAPLDAPQAGCRFTTARGRLVVQLREAARAFEADTTIAGRPATTKDVSGGQVVSVVALTDDGPVPGGQHLPLRILEVTADGAVVTRVLTEIVPLLVKDGEPLPAIDDSGEIPYATTPLTRGGQFLDLPQPVQALQLCTVLLEGGDFRVPATEVSVYDTGSCWLMTAQGKITVEATQAVGDTYADTVAGRPADVVADLSSVRVRLRDGAAIDLDVSGPGSVALAEKLVPLLVT